jgi:hypothetical protein
MKSLNKIIKIKSRKNKGKNVLIFKNSLEYERYANNLNRIHDSVNPLEIEYIWTQTYHQLIKENNNEINRQNN